MEMIEKPRSTVRLPFFFIAIAVARSPKEWGLKILRDLLHLMGDCIEPLLDTLHEDQIAIIQPSVARFSPEAFHLAIDLAAVKTSAC